MPNMRRLLVLPFAVLAACGRGGAVAPSPVRPAPPPSEPAAAAVDSPAVPPRPRNRLAPPAVAFQLGLMPLSSTGVSGWRLQHPTWDGRGVLIAILDAGVDPGIAGLGTTPQGEPKILDLRDFSDEGRVELRVGQGVWTGVLREIWFGDLPQADLNGDGDNRDAFRIEVARDAEGWKARVDANGDGSLDDETWLRDYLVRRETFTFASRWVPRGRGPVTAALNLGEEGGRPRLVVYVDNSGHGSHVAGIAAGYAIYGQSGLNGVAPGAQILALKIADNLRGGVSTTGSFIRAMEYAVRFARERQLPLVMNLSFGVGNSQPGRAVMDSIVDAFLLAHPDVFFTIATGNDGPGTETIGLPGSAELAASVGATYPASLAAVQFGTDREVLAWWSGRGGSLAKPDFLTPGLAYSTVPGWNVGDEIKGGTSMAAPHGAGLAALLLSAFRQQGRPLPSAAELGQALRATAVPIEGAPAVDQGAGLANVQAAYRWLQAGHEVVRYRVQALPPAQAAPPGLMRSQDQVAQLSRTRLPTGAMRRGGLATAADTVQRFRVSAVPVPGMPNRARRYRLVSDADWLRAAQPAVTVDSITGSAVVEVRYDAARLTSPGRHTGALVGVSEQDSLAGPAFTLLNTVIVPAPGETTAARGRRLPGGRAARYYLRVPEGAMGLGVRLALRDSSMHAMLSLFEPTGRPARGLKNADVGGEDGREAVLAVTAEDAVPGVWEIVVQALPGDELSYDLWAGLAPVRLAALDSAAVPSVRLTATAETALTARVDHLGIARSWTVTIDSAPWRSGFDVPAWATAMVVEVEVTPEIWNAVTDFAITVFDSAGARLGNGAMNYPFHRVRMDSLPLRRPDGYRATLDLFPGFARPEAPRIEARVTVRFEGEPQAIATHGGGTPWREAGFTVPLTGRPFTPPPGWRRLLRLSVGADDPLAATRLFTVDPE